MSREVEDPEVLAEREARSLRQKTREKMRHLQYDVGDLEQKTRRVDDELRSEQCLLLCQFRKLRKNMDKVIELPSRRKRFRRKVRNSAMAKSSTDKYTEENGGKKRLQDMKNISPRHKGDDCDQADAAKKGKSSEGGVTTTTITRRRSSVPACTIESLPQLQHQKKCAKSCKLQLRRRYSLPSIQPHDKERHELTKIAEEEEEVETTTTRRRMSVPVESLHKLQGPKNCLTFSKDVLRRRHSFPAIQPNQNRSRDELHAVVEGDEHNVTKKTVQVQTGETRDEAMKKASALLRERLFPSIVTPVLDLNNSPVQPTEQKTQLPPKFESESALDTDLKERTPPKTGQRKPSVVCIDGTAVTRSQAEHVHRRRSFPTLCAEHCKPRLGPELRTGDMTSWLGLGTKTKSRIYSISVDSGYVIRV